MKRITTLLALCMLSVSSWFTAEAIAQNKLFAKYNDMDNVQYICITKSMLKYLVGNNSATINGVHIDGITSALNTVLIIRSEDAKEQKIMRDDFATIKADKQYEMLMSSRNNDQRVSAYLKTEKDNLKELVMNIDAGDKEQIFIVLTGTFTDQQLAKLLNGE